MNENVYAAITGNVVRSDGQSPAQIFCNIKSVLLAGIQQVFILRMFGNVKFVAEKRPYALHLQDALAAVHHRQFIG